METNLKPLSEMAWGDIMKEAKERGIPEFNKLKKADLLERLEKARAELKSTPEVVTPGQEKVERAVVKNFVCEVPGCKESFDSAFELSKHMATHSVPEDQIESDTFANQETELPPVIIRTTAPVWVGVNNKIYQGTELTVPFIQAGEVKRLLVEGYGPTILAE